MELLMQSLSNAARHGLRSSKRLLAFGGRILLDLLQAEEHGDALFATLDGEVVEKAERILPSTTLGNDESLRVWHGSLDTLPAYQGPFDVALFAQSTDDWEEVHEALLQMTFLLRPGSTIILEHCSLPTGGNIDHVSNIICDLPLKVKKEETKDTAVILTVPPGYTFSKAPIVIEEDVVTGFGRGSKQMGTPTANLRPDDLFAGPLNELPLGVYFGWAQLQGADAEHNTPFKTVLNIGKRPSIQDGEQRTVELYIMHDFHQDFYGQRVKAVLLGFIRPEIRFPGLPALIRRINMDKGLAKTQLDLPMHTACLPDVFA